MSLTVEVVHPQSPPLAVRLDGGLRIGKNADNDVVVAHPLVSRHHCRVEMETGRPVVFDLGSTNGTFIGERRLPPRQAVAWNAGDVLLVGDTRLRWRDPAAMAPSMPSAALAAPAPAAAAAAGGSPSGERLVIPVELKRKLHALLLDRMDLRHTDTSDRTHEELRAHTTQVCRALVAELDRERPDWLAPETLVKEVVDEAVGLGVLEDLLAEESIDEIMVCNWDKVYVERRGRLELVNRQFTDNAQVVAIIRRILAPLGRRIDETTPLADGRLADGSRVNAIIAPLALSGPTLTIRKFAKTPFTARDMVERFHSLTRPMVDFLELAVKQRANILISGGTGSGKTTLLNIVSNFIPGGERIVTVEDAAELQLAQDHVIRLESRPPNLEGKNAILIRDLVKNSLRMRPDRIVVGECRGGEALDMLQAMNTGHDGSLTTLHANSPRDALARLETLVLMSGMELPARAIREQVASAIDFIVQIARLPDGSRKVTNISEITGMEGEVVTLQSLFSFEQSGFDKEGRVLGSHKATGMIPEFVQTLQRRGIPVDISLFRAPERPAPA